MEEPRSNYEYLLLISHDLRSAMSDIVGGMQLLDRSELNDANLKHVERVSAASQSLMRLIDEAFSKLDGADSILTNDTQFELAEFLENTRNRWEGRAISNGVRFVEHFGTGLPAVVEIDLISLDRILSNLLGNALKYSAGGLVGFSVEMNANEALVFRIEDNGVGFSDAAIDRLFEYEGRPKESAQPGSGLGLHIAKALADLLGSQLEVRNGPEKGAVCELTIPQDRWRVKQAVQGTPLSESLPDLSGLAVLLAEDNATNQLVASQMLKSMGATVEIVADGVEALEAIETQHFDVAFLDIEMPRMSGLELIRKVRSMDGEKSALPMIALTAYVMAEHRDRILKAGANAIVAKPIASVAALGQAAMLELGITVKASAPLQSEAGYGNNQVDAAVFDALMASVGSELGNELITKLNEDIASAGEGLRNGLARNDRKILQSETHVLTSVAGVIGAYRLQDLATKLNAATHDEDGADIDQLTQSCISQLDQVDAFIRQRQRSA